MPKIKIDSNLYSKIKKANDEAGYSNIEEFIVHVIEKELSNYENKEKSEKITERLKGLGYID